MQGRTLLCVLAFVAAVIAQCPPSQGTCNGGCYDKSVYSCVTSPSGVTALCPVNLQLCGSSACYNPNTYHCVNSGLVYGAAPAQATPSTSAAKAATSSAAAAQVPTTSSAAQAKPTTSSAAQAKPTTSSAAAATSQAAAAPATTSAAASPVAQVPSPCYTANYCAANMCSCNGACYTPGQYNCPTDGFTNKLVLCSGNFGACNGNCYDTTQNSCVNGKVVAGGGSPIATPSTSSAAAAPSTTKAAAAATTTANSPVVNPTPAAGNGFPTQTADLRIINNCKTTLWFEARYGGAGAPLPGQSVTAQQALPGSYIDYTVPDTGLSGSRFWAKYGCDSNGQNCAIGDQMQYWPNPPGGCPAGGCTPPVDSLFEATWGCRPGTSCNAGNPTTWFDTSQVDGWTIPYKLTPVGDTSGCDCTGTGCGFKGVDASTLDVTKCPSGEDLSDNGQFTSVNVLGQSVGLSSVDLRIIKNGEILGCMSPCKRLNWGVPYGLQQSEDSGSTMWMCCPTPTPNNCNPSQGCVSPTTCRAGPIENTQFVAAVHTMAPGVYAYSYDDGVGLHACPAGVTKYTMEFCPSGSAAYPGTA